VEGERKWRNVNNLVVMEEKGRKIKNKDEEFEK